MILLAPTDRLYYGFYKYTLHRTANKNQYFHNNKKKSMIFDPKLKNKQKKFKNYSSELPT